MRHTIRSHALLLADQLNEIPDVMTSLTKPSLKPQHMQSLILPTTCRTNLWLTSDHHATHHSISCSLALYSSLSRYCLNCNVLWMPKDRNLALDQEHKFAGRDFAVPEAWTSVAIKFVGAFRNWSLCPSLMVQRFCTSSRRQLLRRLVGKHSRIHSVSEV